MGAASCTCLPSFSPTNENFFEKAQRLEIAYPHPKRSQFGHSVSIPKIK